MYRNNEHWVTEQIVHRVTPLTQAALQQGRGRRAVLRTALCLHNQVGSAQHTDIVAGRLP